MDPATAKTLDECFLSAIRNQYISRIEALLNQNFSPNNSSDECQHPLDLAIELNNFQIISLLIDRGAHTNSPIDPIKKQIALHRAVIRGNKGIILKVLEHTATPSATDIEGASVLHLANEIKCQDTVIDIMKIFLDLGMNVDLRNFKGETALFVAGKHQRKEVIEFLLERGADLNARDINGNSLIHYSLKETQNDEQLDKEYFIDWLLLVKGADVNCINNARESPVQLASRIRSRNALRLLLKHVGDLRSFRDEQNRTILHMVLELKNVVKSREGDEDYSKWIREIDWMIDLLLEKGLSVNASDNNGNTAFHVAIERIKWFAVPKLLRHLDDVNARNNQGQTPLHVMIDFGNSSQGGFVNAVNALMSKNVDIEIKDNDGHTPLHVALQTNNRYMVEKLMELGADVNAEVPNTSILHLAVDCGVDIVRALVRAGTYFDVVDDYGFPPLHYAMKLNYDVMAYLLECGANVDGINIANELKSLVACKSIRRCMAKLAHANLHVPNCFGPASDYTVDRPDLRDESLGSEFHRSCQYELRKMKKYEIGDHQATLYDFLHSNLKQRIRWLGLVKLQNIMKLRNLEFNFPLYRDIIKGKHLQAVERRTVLESAENALRQIANVAVPDICLEYIFSHLDNPSLFAVIKAVNLKANSVISSMNKKRRIV